MSRAALAEVSPGVLQALDGVGRAIGDGHAGLDRPRAGGGGVGGLGGRAGDLGEDRVDASGGLAGLLGQRAHLVGDDGEAAPVLARPRRLDRGVEGQEVGALGQLADGDGDLAGAPDELGQAAHVGGDGLDATAGLAHPGDHGGDGLAALRGQAARFLGAVGDGQGVLGGAGGVGAHVGDGPGDVLDGAVLLVGGAHAGGGLGDQALDAGEHEGRGLRGAAGELAVAGQRRLAVAHRGVEAGDDAVELVVARVERGVLGLQDVGMELGLAPAHEQGDDLDDHEEGVDGDAAEGVGQGVRAGPEDLLGRDHADHGVVEDDEADRQRERQPVEVEPDDGQHREEEEVRLDRAVGQVDEHGRAGHQAQRGDARAAAAREAAPARRAAP